MDKVITTVLLTITAVLGATMIASSAFPMLSRGTSAMAAAGTTMESRLQTSISVIHAIADQGQNQVYVWVKNVGAIAVAAPQRADVFLQTPSGTYDRLPYGSGAGKWQYALLDGNSEWTPGTTMKITISLASVSAGRYEVTLVTPNGIATRAAFSV